MCYSDALKERIRGLDTDNLIEHDQHFELMETNLSINETPDTLKQSLQETRHKIHTALLNLFRISTTPSNNWHSLLNSNLRVSADSNWSRLPDEHVTFILTFMSQLYMILSSIYNSVPTFSLDLSKSILWYNGGRSTGLQIENDKTEFAISCGLVHYSLDKLFSRTTDNIIIALSCQNQSEKAEMTRTLQLTEHINKYIDKWNHFNDDYLRNPFS